MMKFLTTLLFINLVSLVGISQSVVGTWKTIDDVDGTEKSHVELTIENNQLIGKIIKGLDPSIPNKCEKCEGDLKNAPMIGLQIIEKMKQDGDQWKGGKILDPANGKQYKCKISLESEDVLLVRGYIGFSLMGRTQKWYRVKGSDKTQ